MSVLPAPATLTRSGFSPALLAGAVVVGLTLIPLGYVVVATASMGPGQLGDLLFRPRVGELLGNTLRLLLGTVAATLVIGVGAAVAVVRTDLGARSWTRGFWHAALSAPLAVPAFVNSYGWVSLTSAVQSYWGAVLVVSLSYFPLVYLPVVAGLSRLDAAPEEVARSLGRSRLGAFLSAGLPRLLPAVLGGALLVGLHVLAEFGALQLLDFPTFTTAIYGQYRSAFASDAGTVLAGVLVALCVLLLLVELALRGRRRSDRVGGAAGRPVEPVVLGAAKPLVALVLLGLTALSVGVPLYALAHWLRVGSSTTFPVGELTGALSNTVLLAALGALITVLMAMPLAWIAVRRRGPVSTALERSAYVANALPGIVVALALITVTIRWADPLYQTLPVLLIAYGILFLPRALVSVRSSLEQAPPVLEDVARSLGQSSWTTMRRVTLRLVAPGIAAGAALVFLAISTELTATLLLAPIGTDTLATEFWSASSSVRYGAAAPYALLLILAALPATVMLSVQSRPGEAVRMSSVVIRDLTKAFGRTEVLHGVDLVVPDGGLTAVLGSSGCGKTTLLRIVAGFLRADSGTVALGDRVVEDGRTAVAPDKRGVGYVPQEGALFPHLDVAANILFGLPRAERSRARLDELLELAELPHEIARRNPHELSGGQQQRVALARALAPRPRVILLDEPFSSLDAGLRVSAGRSVRRVLQHAGATALLVTHDQGEALSLADEVAVMRAGRFVQIDTPAGLYERPADAETARFVGGGGVLPGSARAGVVTTALGALRAEVADGPVDVLVRPEQLHLDAPGTGVVEATVTEVSFYGAHVIVHLVLDEGTVVTARGPAQRTPSPGDRVGLRVDGAVVAFPRGGA